MPCVCDADHLETLISELISAFFAASRGRADQAGPNGSKRTSASETIYHGAISSDYASTIGSAYMLLSSKRAALIAQSRINSRSLHER